MPRTSGQDDQDVWNRVADLATADDLASGLQAGLGSPWVECHRSVSLGELELPEAFQMLGQETDGFTQEPVANRGGHRIRKLYIGEVRAGQTANLRETLLWSFCSHSHLRSLQYDPSSVHQCRSCINPMNRPNR
jgi:hypothetical protein